MELLYGYVCVLRSYTAGHYLFFCLYVIIISFFNPFKESGVLINAKDVHNIV